MTIPELPVPEPGIIQVSWLPPCWNHPSRGKIRIMNHHDAEKRERNRYSVIRLVLFEFTVRRPIGTGRIIRRTMVKNLRIETFDPETRRMTLIDLLQINTNQRSTGLSTTAEIPLQTRIEYPACPPRRALIANRRTSSRNRARPSSPDLYHSPNHRSCLRIVTVDNFLQHQWLHRRDGPSPSESLRDPLFHHHHHPHLRLRNLVLRL